MTDERNSRRNPLVTRREALSMLGAGAAVAFSRNIPVFGAAEPQFPKGAVIRTVLKDLPPSALAGGTTLFHEHLTHSADWYKRMDARPSVQAAARGRGAPPAAPNPDPAAQPAIIGCPTGVWEGCANLDFLVEEVKRAKRDGVVCIADGSHPDGNRDIGLLTQISQRSGVSIIASGGYYLDEMYPPEISKWTEDQISEEIIRDATVNPLGALGEIGTSAEITPNEHKVLRAVGKAHLATNLPIFTHTDNGKCAEQQLDIFESVGVKPQHVVIGHISSMRETDVEMQKRLCQRGAFIGFDRQGAQNDDRNVPMVVKLLEAGYTNNLVFSADFGNAARNSQAWAQNGGTGLSRTVTVWAAKLRAAGVKDETLHSILVDNSRRFLAFVPKKSRPSGK